MFRICGGLLMAFLVTGCASTSTPDAYPANWIPASSMMGPIQPPQLQAAAIPLAQPAMPATSTAALGYAPWERCYVVIENKLPIVEICQQGNFISYNPVAGADMASIIPPEINGVLVMQGHLLPLTASADTGGFGKPALTASTRRPDAESIQSIL